MSALTRPQKITFGQMRASGVRGVIVSAARSAESKQPIAC
jgi:hypothetical protein